MAIEDEADEGTALASVPGLSRCERSLLEVLARPGSHRLKVAQVAKQAGISLASFHRFMRDPDFKATAMRLITSMLLRRMSPQVARLLAKARGSGGEGGHLLDAEQRKTLQAAQTIAATQTRILGGKVLRNVRGLGGTETVITAGDKPEGL
jgi:AcrR family transcriptional regulator